MMVLIFLIMHLRRSLVSQLVLQLMFTGSVTRYFYGKVNPWRHGKTKRLGDRTQVELVDIEDVFLVVRCVRLEVRSVTILRRAIQVVVLFDQFHELLLNVCQLALRELILIWPNFLLLQVAEEAKFVLENEEQCAARPIGTTCRPTNTMNVIIWVIWWIELDNPVNVREIESPLRYIRAE